MNLQLFISGFSVEFEQRFEDMFIIDRIVVSNLSVEFVQDKSDIVFPEALVVGGFTVDEVMATRASVYRRRFV